MVARPETLPVDAASEAAAATRALFEQHGRMVLSICRSLLRGGHEAEDAAQETFLAAHRSLLAGRGPRQPGAWLATIARNECRARLKNRPVVVEYSEADGAPIVDGDDALHAVVDELKAAIAQLPPRQRESVVLREFYGLSPREVAAAMGLTTPVVDSLLLRARRKLRKQLAALRSSACLALSVQQLREALERAVPGFGFEASAGAVGGTAGVGLAAKVAAAAIGIAAVGSVGSVGHEAREPAAVPPARPAPVVQHVTTARRPTAPVVVTPERAAADELVQRSREKRRSRRLADRSGLARPSSADSGAAGTVPLRAGTSGDDSGVSPGPGSGFPVSSDVGESRSSRSGSGSGSGSGAGSSGSSGSGSSGSGDSGSSGSGDSGSSGSGDSGSSGSGDSGSSGSGDSGSGGSGSGSSGSSGSGSGDQSGDLPEAEPTSG